ncbi:DUF3006 domain-containing protein [Halomarina rubra]|uniref:DUF3006 domain-containing protein n=1 Tax=Halomarina rubra TaxID=2071873 RepID=A0ABD6B012_9EURY
MFGLRPALCVLVCCALVSPVGQPRTTAVVDRFEADRAVLVTDDGRMVTVGHEALPPEARHVDAVVHVALAHGTLVSAEYDASETRRRAGRARGRLDRLARPLVPPGNQS